VSNPLDELEAKKAKILADAQKQAAEIDADMDALKVLSTKYGLDFVARTKEGDVVAVQVKSKSKSLFSRVRSEGEAIIRQVGKPVPLGEVYDELERRGIHLSGNKPRNLLSAYLGYNPNLRSTPQGWWLKDAPIPRLRLRRPDLDEPSGADNDSTSAANGAAGHKEM
jgi:hypothetical protein